MDAHYADLWHRIALAVPDRPALTTIGESTLSYAEFDDAAARFAALLGELGIGRDDKVSIVLHNRPEWLIAFAGCLRIGAVPVAINFRYLAAEIAALLDDSDSAAVVYGAAFREAVGDAVASLGRPIELLQVQDVPGVALLPGARDFAAIREVEPRPYQHPGDGDFFIYTGGTTGSPKAAMWGVRQMMAMQTLTVYLMAGLPDADDEDHAVALATAPDSPHIVALALSPYMHGTALTTVINTLLLGGTVVILPTVRFDPALAVRTLRDEGVTRLAVAGDAVAIPLIEAADDAGVTELPALTTILSSGMRFSDTTKERLHGLAPNVVITDILASTEGGAMALGVTRSATDLPARFRLTRGAVVLDDALDEVQSTVGAVGRLAFTGGMPSGYYKDPVKTAENFVEIRGRRHIIPGDFVRVEEDAYIELLGRGASVVNSGGEKVYPAEVEESLLRFPGVTDAVVIGIPDPRWGEVVAAAVAVADPTTTSLEDLVAHVGTELAGYKKPRRILALKDLERSPTGKVELAVLRARIVADGLAL